jgi:hypothetical protein
MTDLTRTQTDLACERRFTPPFDPAAYTVRQNDPLALPVATLGLLQAIAASEVTVTFQWQGGGATTVGVLFPEIVAVTEEGQRFAILAWEGSVGDFRGGKLLNLVNAAYRNLRMAHLQETAPGSVELGRLCHGPAEDRE